MNDNTLGFIALIYFFLPGWFLRLSSLIGFGRIQHREASICATQGRGSPTSQETE